MLALSHLEAPSQGGPELVTKGGVQYISLIRIEETVLHETKPCLDHL